MTPAPCSSQKETPSQIDQPLLRHRSVPWHFGPLLALLVGGPSHTYTKSTPKRVPAVLPFFAFLFGLKAVSHEMGSVSFYHPDHFLQLGLCTRRLQFWRQQLQGTSGVQLCGIKDRTDLVGVGLDWWREQMLTGCAQKANGKPPRHLQTEADSKGGCLSNGLSRFQQGANSGF